MTAPPSSTAAAGQATAAATGGSGSSGPAGASPAGQPEERLTIAVSGLALTLFLVAHLGAVSLALLAPPRFEALADWLASTHPTVEVITVDGGQPLWPVIIGVE